MENAVDIFGLQQVLFYLVHMAEKRHSNLFLREGLLKSFVWNSTLYRRHVKLRHSSNWGDPISQNPSGWEW